jgi:Flp pilus assembly protein TadD
MERSFGERQGPVGVGGSGWLVKRLRRGWRLCYASGPMVGRMALVLLAMAGEGSGSGVEEVLALEQAGRDEAAFVRAEQLALQVPPSALPHLEAARLGLKLGRDLAMVERHLQAARTLAPDNPRLRMLSALVREGQGDDAGARLLYLEALSLRSNYTEARTRLVALGIRTGDWPLAEQQLRALIVAGDASVGRRLQLSRVLEDASKLTEAEAILKALHRQAPENAAVTSALASFYERHDRMEEALALRRPTPVKKLRPLQPSRH